MWCACAVVNAPPKEWPSPQNGLRPYRTATILSRIFFAGDRWQVRRGFRQGAGNFVERVGHRADEIADTFAGGGGDGMKFKFVFLAKIAERFEACAVRGGVELGRHDNHWFFYEGFAEGAQFTGN